GGGNLAGAGGLGAVADDTGGNGQGVDDGVGGLTAPTAQQAGDARPGAGPGAHGAAVGGEAADALLLVDGGEIGEGEGTVETFRRTLKGSGVFDDGEGDRHALIAAAGVDDHGQFTAAHPGVGA